MTVSNPLEILLGEMLHAADAGLGLVALSAAVSIPAICASLEMENGRSQREEYLAWCRSNLLSREGFRLISAEELYSIRCGLLHQGQVALSSFHKGEITTPYKHKSVVFLMEMDWVAVGENSAGEQYVTSLKTFCDAMAGAARNWIGNSKSNEVVCRNLDQMMSYRPLKSRYIQIEPTPTAIY